MVNAYNIAKPRTSRTFTAQKVFHNDTFIGNKFYRKFILHKFFEALFAKQCIIRLVLGILLLTVVSQEIDAICIEKYNNECCAYNIDHEADDTVRTTTASDTFHLSAGNWYAVVKHYPKKTLTIYTSRGRIVATNKVLLRSKDGNGNCPSEGFLQVTSKGSQFTIEQQSCSGWLFIDEFFTFKYNPKNTDSSSIFLHNYRQCFTDRRNPDNRIQDKNKNYRTTKKIRLSRLDIRSFG